MKTIRTGDQNLVKQLNKSIVFNFIEHKGPVSRAQISKDTGLNKATVSTMASELINDSFIYEIGEGQSSGGRKPVMLYFNNHAGYSIGIDLGVNYILGVLSDLRGNIIEEETRSLNDSKLDNVIGHLTAVIESLVKKAPVSPYGVIGIGIGVPGNVDKDDKILFAPNLNWKQVDLKQIIENRFHIPTKIDNEANAGAHGERLYGAGKNIANLIYVSIGIGIGTGIIINNNLYTGSSGISGELGHVTIEASGRKCPCGNRGCWELYASEKALLTAAEEQHLLEKDHAEGLDCLIKEAQMGNPGVLQQLNRLGEYIGIGLVNIVNTFNPEVVVIGNRIARFKHWIINPITHILEERLSPYHKSNTEIRFSELGKHSIAIGAASFSISKFLEDKRVSVQ
ncbi:xylose repressor XylR [Scopulibacillus darangshiensis]|uniref:Xylose repressor XylR n=1 Tax=Scopulibacillus darangshiensis TaxID=442528 RepID=A0A4R2P1S3_9BACL|nr:ROK family transcriptional regulator [Scopulibacillus darangshiensis]TCP27821.1 xylose repressor XylR [Scopulibacillus darangshiensis]